jgi:hypothetical protein
VAYQGHQTSAPSAIQQHLRWTEEVKRSKTACNLTQSNAIPVIPAAQLQIHHLEFIYIAI